MITTDYTAEANPDSLSKGSTQGYRLVHWLKDVLKNMFSDAINLKDERICGLLIPKDGSSDTVLNAIFRIGIPYTGTAKAGITPLILVSAGEVTYPVAKISNEAAVNISKIGGIARYKGMKHKAMKLNIAVITEKYDSTLLLSNLIEDYLIVNEENMRLDCGILNTFYVSGVSAPQELQTDSAGNAKTLYQTVITISATGSVAWISDTQGPVFRGITPRLAMR